MTGSDRSISMMSGASSTARSSASTPLRRLDDVEAGELQVFAVHLARVRIVVDEQHERGPAFWCSSSASLWSASVSVNVEPLPTSLCTRDPAAEHLREPAADREAEAGAAVGARRRVVQLAEVLEDASWSVGAMPMPVSVTDSVTVARRRRASRRSSTPPWCVNLSALLSRLSRICFTFWRSRRDRRQILRQLRA